MINASEARKLDPARGVRAIIAGSAPTASLIARLEQLGITSVHVYGLTYVSIWLICLAMITNALLLIIVAAYTTLSETYGPMTRNYPQPTWAEMSLDERAKFMARQGHAFATADEVRVIEQREDDELVDVPSDGKALGEIVMRGNIVMRDVSTRIPVFG